MIEGRSFVKRGGATAVLGVLAFLHSAARAEPPVARLPEWFEGHRVQLHSEQNVDVVLRLTPEGLAKADRSLGASVATHLLVTLGEGACWPTKAGRTNPFTGDRDFAAEMIRTFHDRGLRLIGYYRHMCDQAMQEERPEWIARHPNGRPVHEVRARNRPIHVLCMNSPYREYTKTRLTELADRGLDVVYFDSWHMPDICVCEYCREAFRKELGHDMNPDAPVGSPAYMEAVEFVNRTMVRTFTEWHRAVRSRKPDMFFAVGSSQYPMFFSPHIDEHLLAISDTSKTEFDKPFGGPAERMGGEKDFAAPAYDDQLALGWSLVRDSSGGRPPLMWVPFLANEKTATYSAAAAVAYGCVASVQAAIRNLDADMAENRGKFPSIFAMGDRVSPYLAYARPVPWAALHISEEARNRRLGDLKRMWREVFSPALGACQALKECHVPWVVLTDGALAAGPVDETRLLVLPCPDDLTDRQKESVAKFERRGGVVIRLSSEAGWYDQTRQSGLLKALLADVRRQAAGMPICIDGPAHMHATCFRAPTEKRYTLCLVNSWSWFRSVRDDRPQVKDQPEPPACADVTFTLASPLGRPRKVFDGDSGKELSVEEADGAFRVRAP